MLTWNDIENQRRWMPVGRPTDAKAPALGYKTDDDTNWVEARYIKTPLAGLNFGPVDGLIGVDLDFKPDEAGSESDLEQAKLLLGGVKSGLLGAGLLCEVSYSGNGAHFFGLADDALMALFRDRESVKINVPLVRGKDKKAVAAVEVFGGGNAYIAVTRKWVTQPSVLRPITRALLNELLPVLSEDAAQRRLTNPATPQSGRKPQQDDVMRLQTLLLQIPVPADYDGWLKLASAAVNAGVSADVVEAWSATGAGYRRGEVTERARKGQMLREPQAGYLVSVAKGEGLAEPRCERRGGGVVFGRPADAGEVKPAFADLDTQPPTPAPMPVGDDDGIPVADWLLANPIPVGLDDWCEWCAEAGYYHRRNDGRCGSGIARVESSTQAGQFHSVNLATGRCDCDGFRYRGRCRHIVRAFVDTGVVAGV